MDDRIAVALRGFGPVGILAILVIMAGNLVVDMATKAEAANQMAWPSPSDAWSLLASHSPRTIR